MVAHMYLNVMLLLLTANQYITTVIKNENYTTTENIW